MGRSCDRRSCKAQFYKLDYVDMDGWKEKKMEVNFLLHGQTGLKKYTPVTPAFLNVIHALV